VERASLGFSWVTNIYSSKWSIILRPTQNKKKNKKKGKWSSTIIINGDHLIACPIKGCGILFIYLFFEKSCGKNLPAMTININAQEVTATTLSFVNMTS